MNEPLHRYQAYYCEENVWRLFSCRPTPVGAVLLISNPAKKVAMYRQRAHPSQWVVWDYHVVAVRPCGRHWRVEDLDSTLPFGVQLQDYLRESFFRVLGPEFDALFRPVPSEEYVRRFWTDRSHMLQAGTGAYLQPPPPWPAPRSDHPQPLRLAELLDFEERSAWVTVETLPKALQELVCG